MHFNNLRAQNIPHFRRYYKLIAAATVITVAVIVGSLVVGDSIRTTLLKRVEERLGNTETIIFSRNSFMGDKMLGHAAFKDARGILLSNGFVSAAGKLIPVMVWGVDDKDIPASGAKINPALHKELSPAAGNDIVLRLPTTGLTPSGSLFVTGNYTTGIRLTLGGVVAAQEGGNLSLKNEQIIPFNIFVNRRELAAAMDIEGKMNLILAAQHISSADLDKAWDYTASGITVRRKDKGVEITSDRIFLQEQVVQTIAGHNANTNKLFSYLVNAMEAKAKSIPYSFVTAMEHYKGVALHEDEIILSDYAAHRLGATLNDTVRLTYFTSQDLKTLFTNTVKLKVRQIVPLRDFCADSTLSANFPGLSDVDNCTDWDSDLPIDMKLVTKEDEDYWDLYRTTPKAIIPYMAVAKDWSNAYGNATAVRIDNTTPDLSALSADMFGIQLIYPKDAGLYAAKNGVDFSSLFLSLGFFIIVSALLLMLVPLSEMLHQREAEFTLLKALGYPRKRIVQLLWRETAPVVLLSSVAGVAAGLIYTFLITWLLGNVWKGATHTNGFAVFPNVPTLLIGLLAGIVISLLLLRIAIVRTLKGKTHSAAKPQKRFTKRKLFLAVTASVFTLLITFVNLAYLQSVALFVVVGVILLGTAALWGDYWVCRKGAASNTLFSSAKLMWATLYADKKRALLSFFTLSTGVFIVFSVGLNRQGFTDGAQLQTGTGGYTLWCESAVPLYRNISTQEGREKLALTDLPANAEVLQCLRYSADDASCLNLNKVSTPTVLGVDMQALANSRFEIAQSLYATDNRAAFFATLQTPQEAVYPALVDATVLTWSLGLRLGDTIRYELGNGRSALVQFVGTLQNSIFQGNILIDKALFSGLWEEVTGSEVFLLKVADSERDAAKTLLSQALNEYGVKVSATTDRLKEFNSVTDTYLTIFMTLGGLGLLLGIMSFIIVIRKNLAARKSEIALYRTLGYNYKKIETNLYNENLVVPLYAVVTGVVASLVGVSSNFSNVGVGLWVLALLLTMFFVGCILVFVKKSVRGTFEN